MYAWRTPIRQNPFLWDWRFRQKWVIIIYAGTHSSSEEEKVSFVEHMNHVLKGNPVADARLPIDPNTMDLFTKVKDGILLWYVNLRFKYS